MPKTLIIFVVISDSKSSVPLVDSMKLVKPVDVDQF